MSRMFFFHGDIKEELFMEPPREFRETFGKNKICRLKKVLHRLKQSPWIWFGRFAGTTRRMGYRQRSICFS